MAKNMARFAGCLLLASLASCALSPPAFGQASKYYQNSDSTVSPSVVILCPSDATHSATCTGLGGLGGLANTTGPTYTNGQTVSNFSFDLAGNLRTTGSGGGSGGAVTSIDGGLVTLGTEADAAWSGAGSGTAIAVLKNLATNSTGPIPAGTNVIGSVLPTVGYASFATSHATLTSASATQVVAARTGAPGVGRGEVTITNEDATLPVQCGNSSVTITSGVLIAAGGARTFKTTAAVYCISASGSPVVDSEEHY